MDTTDPRVVDFNVFLTFVFGPTKDELNGLGLWTGARGRRGYVDSKVGRSEDRDSS